MTKLVGGIYLYRDSGIHEVFYSALGKAAMDDASNHGSPGALRIYPYGDTPTGTYHILTNLSADNYGVDWNRASQIHELLKRNQLFAPGVESDERSTWGRFDFRYAAVR